MTLVGCLLLFTMLAKVTKLPICLPIYQHVSGHRRIRLPKPVYRETRIILQ